MTPPLRQPVHVVYGGAHRFKADSARRLGELARAALATHAPDGPALACALGWSSPDDPRHAVVFARVAAKLEREAVEDFRIDFEDGYGPRADAEEDGHAVAAAQELARGLRDGTLPPVVGMRPKAFSGAGKARCQGTVDLFLGTLVAQTGGILPAGFRITLPKVAEVAEVSAFVGELASVERRLALPEGALLLEVMVEHPGLLAPGALQAVHAAAGGRLVGAHLGPFDLTASIEVPAIDQGLAHPVCEAARLQMQLAFAGTGVAVSDGPTALLPIGTTDVVHAAWRASAANIRRALSMGVYQGWDLHPAQLPARYAALFGFWLENLPAAAARLRNFQAQSAQATRIGAVFDDAASVRGLVTYFRRGLACGALVPDDLAAHGLASAP